MTASTVASDAVEAIRERVEAAATAGAPLRVVGSGTWLDAGQPVDAAEELSTRDLRGVVEYVPGDLTLTARAGTSLAEIRAVTAPEQQWLALDPFGSDDGTIGATVATGSWGPLATFFGAPRDLVLGLEIVTGTGSVVRGGGRVVKNVAGFDLTRLVTGSWGTLGVITEVTVRLHARPEADRTVVIGLTDGSAGVQRIGDALRTLPFRAYACELLNDAFARSLGVADQTTVLVRLAGNGEAVAAQRASLERLGDTRDAANDVWNRLRHAEPRDAIVFRCSRRRSHLAEIWQHVATVSSACPGTLVHATPERGVVRCMVPTVGGGMATEHVKRALGADANITSVGERMPAELWGGVAPTPADPARQRLWRGIQQAFDPGRVLNPGILGSVV